MASIRTPRVVVFDCGGVLADDCPVLCYQKLALSYPAEERDRIRQLHTRNYLAWNTFKLEKRYHEEDYWKDVITGEKLTETIDEMKTFLRDSLASFPGSLDIAQRLKSTPGIEAIGIMSNHSEEWFAAIAAKFDFGRVFTDSDLVVVSQAVGAAKPDDKIMEILMQRLRAKVSNLEKSEVLFIDDKKANADAAKKFGLQAFVFDAPKETPDQLLARLQAHGVQIK